MIIDEETYLEHYGVQGMKWGQRRATNKANVARLQRKGLSKRTARGTVRYQNKVDMQRMAATGRNGKVGLLKQMNNRAVSNTNLSLLTTLKHPLSAKKAASLQLQKNATTQKKVMNGEKKVTSALLKFGGVSIKDIDFSV